jgi:hypothetical protein
MDSVAPATGTFRPAHAFHFKCDYEALRQPLLAYLENNARAHRENCGWTGRTMWASGR